METTGWQVRLKKSGLLQAYRLTYSVTGFCGMGKNTPLTLRIATLKFISDTSNNMIPGSFRLGSPIQLMRTRRAEGTLH